jgi:hypothetical protein
MAKTQQAAKTAKKAPPSGVHQVSAGTMTGPKGKKLVDAPNPEHQMPVEHREGERRQAQADAVMAFSTSQMSAPAAHAPTLTPEQVKRQEFDAAVAKLAAEMGVTAPTVATKAPRPDKNQRNGITRPAAESITGKVWAAADAISVANNGAPATIAAVKAHPTMTGVNDHTVKTQYARWRAFNNIKGRLQVIKVAEGSGVVASHDGNP